MSVDERRVSMLQVGEYEGGGRLRTFFGVILSRVCDKRTKTGE